MSSWPEIGGHIYKCHVLDIIIIVINTGKLIITTVIIRII